MPDPIYSKKYANSVPKESFGDNSKLAKPLFLFGEK